MLTKPKETLVYTRVSSDRQKKEGHGLDGQEHRCREYAKQRGYFVEEVFRDSFTGGGDFLKRPEMSRLLKYLDDRPHKNYIVIFDDLKRLARDTAFYLKLRKEFDLRGAKLESPNFTFEDTPEGQFIETILAAQGELERKQNRRQVIQKMKARLESGYWSFYPPPGYKSIRHPQHGKILIPDEPTASIIREAFEGFASGRFVSQMDVLRFLQEKEFRGSGRVHISKVQDLLQRLIYTGYIEYPKWNIERRLGHHEGIISLGTYEKVQHRISQRKKIITITPRKTINPDFPLREFVLCRGCSNPLTASWSRGRKNRYPYYRCKTVTCPYANKSIRKDFIESDFTNTLIKIAPKHQIIELTKAIAKDIWDQKLVGLDNEISDKEKEMGRIMTEKDTFLKRIVNTTKKNLIHAYEAKFEELEASEAKLREETEVYRSMNKDFGIALDEVLGFIKSPYSTWINGDINDQRLVLKLVFARKISYDRENGFGTTEISDGLKLFKLIDTSDSPDVEMGGLNPRPM